MTSEACEGKAKAHGPPGRGEAGPHKRAGPPHSALLLRPQGLAGPLSPSSSIPLPPQSPESSLNSDSLLYSSKKYPDGQGVGRGLGGAEDQVSSMSVQCSCEDKRTGQRQPRVRAGVGRLGPKPPLTSSNSKSSSSSSVPTWHSQIRSPHSSEFLQLPRSAVGRTKSQTHKPPPGQAFGGRDKDSAAPGPGRGPLAPPSQNSSRLGRGCWDSPWALALQRQKLPWLLSQELLCQADHVGSEAAARVGAAQGALLFLLGRGGRGRAGKLREKTRRNDGAHVPWKEVWKDAVPEASRSTTLQVTHCYYLRFTDETEAQRGDDTCPQGLG